MDGGGQGNVDLQKPFVGETVFVAVCSFCKISCGRDKKGRSSGLEERN